MIKPSDDSRNWLEI